MQAPQDMKESLQYTHKLSAQSTGNPLLRDSASVPTAISDRLLSSLLPSAQRPVVAFAAFSLPRPVIAIAYAMGQAADPPDNGVLAICKVSAFAQDATWTERLKSMGTIGVWDVAHPGQLRGICAAQGALQCVACGPSAASTTVFAGGADGALYAWDLASAADATVELAGCDTVEVRMPAYSTSHLAGQVSRRQGTGDVALGLSGPVRCLCVREPSIEHGGSGVKFALVALSGWACISVWNVETWSAFDGISVADDGLRSGAPSASFLVLVSPWHSHYRN